MKKLLNNKFNIILIIFIIEIVFLMYSFPVLHDDLLHGSLPFGLNFMPHVNGRYLGNFFGVVLAGSLVLRVIIKSLVILLIIFLSKKILKIKDNIYLLMFISLILFMPKEMFREIIPFTAGFSNYVIPIVGILFIIYSHFTNKINKNNIYIIILFFLVGIFNSLFAEHIAIFNLILAIYLILYYYLKTKKINCRYLAYFIGSLVGIILMFTNPTYLVAASGEDTYRAFSTFQEILQKPWAILRAAFFHNYIMNFSLIFLGIFLYNKTKEKNYLTKFVISFILLFGFYSLIKLFNLDIEILVNYTKHFEALLVFTFFLSLGYLVYISKVLTKSQLYRVSFYAISIITNLAPLVMVSPLGPRCYIMPYILMIILIIDLFMILERKKIININKVSNVIITVLVIQMISYLNIYGQIYLKNIERLKSIDKQISQNLETINIINLPYSDYLHMSTFCSEYSKIVLREYYRLPSNIQIDGNCK